MSNDVISLEVVTNVSKAIAPLIQLEKTFERLGKLQSKGVNVKADTLQALRSLSNNSALSRMAESSFTKGLSANVKNTKQQSMKQLEAELSIQEMLDSYTNKAIQKQEKKVAQEAKIASQLQKQEEYTKKMAEQFDMRYLSIMFGGMYLQSFGKTLISLVLPAMGRFADFQHKGVKAVNAMNASLEFMKFSLFDAFSQTWLFREFIELVINISDAVSNFIGKHPGWTTAIASFGAALLTVGTVLTSMAMGYTVLQGVLGLVNILFGTQLGSTAAMTAALTANTAALTANAAAATADAAALGAVGTAAGTAKVASAGFFATLGAAGIATATALVLELAVALGLAALAYTEVQKRKKLLDDNLISNQANATKNFADPMSRGGTTWAPDFVNTNFVQIKTQAETTMDIVNNTVAKSFANLGLNISNSTDNFKKFGSNISAYKAPPIVVEVQYKEVNKPSSVKTLNVTGSMASYSDKYVGSTQPASSTPAPYTQPVGSNINPSPFLGGLA